jgi:hypothetical protein
MPTMCIQCSMKAILAGEPAPVFEEEPAAHQRRLHPDLEATRAERRELERQLEAAIRAGKFGPKP